jgi:hypothetical protein
MIIPSNDQPKALHSGISGINDAEYRYPGSFPSADTHPRIETYIFDVNSRIRIILLRVNVARHVISKDGKTRTVTTTGTNAQGQKVNLGGHAKPAMCGHLKTGHIKGRLKTTP